MPEDDASWKRRFRATRITTFSLAKSNPERGLVVANRGGAYQLHAWDVTSGALRPLTTAPAGLLDGAISPDGSYVYYFRDDNGDELGHFVRVPFTGGPAEDLTPDLPAFMGGQMAFSLTGDLLAFQAYGGGLMLRDLAPDGQLGPLRVLGGECRPGFGPLLSHDGQVMALMGVKSDADGQRILALRTANGELIGELGGGATISATGGLFSPAPGDLRVCGTTYATGDRRPFIWDIRSGERIELAVGDLHGDILPVSWSADGARLLLEQSHRAKVRFYIYDIALAQFSPLGDGSSDFKAVSFAPGGEIFVLRENSAHPPEVVALNGTSGKLERVLLAAEPLPASRRWQQITFPSADEQEIQGWLATPEGDGPFPTSIDMHGGPYIVEMEHYSPESQCWLDHGFAFLTINYSGSISFGRDFQARVWRNPGLPAAADAAAARNWLVQQGIARPDAVLATGWSQGGYLTLLALGKYPDLWAGGMAGAAIADWTLQYNDVSPSSQGFVRHLFGGSPDKVPFRYAKNSPYFYADAVRAPLMIIQGSKDTRTPIRQVEIYAERLRELGRDVELHLYDMGHQSFVANVELAITNQELMLRFAGRVLGQLNT